MAKRVNKKSPAKLNTKPDLNRFNMAPLAKPASPTKKVSPMKDFGITAAIAAKAVAAKAAAAAAAKAVAAAAAKAVAKAAVGKTAAVLGKGIASKAATAVAKGAEIGKAAKLAKGVGGVVKSTLARGTGSTAVKGGLAKASGKGLVGEVGAKFGGKATNLVTKKAQSIVDKVAGKELKAVSNLTKAKQIAKKAKDIGENLLAIGGKVKMGVDFVDSKINKEEPAENKGMNDFANINFAQGSGNRTGYKTPFTMKAGKGGPMKKNYPGLFKK
jgi:hypothetical protein